MSTFRVLFVSAILALGASACSMQAGESDDDPTAEADEDVGAAQEELVSPIAEAVCNSCLKYAQDTKDCDVSCLSVYDVTYRW
jgi:hypothetical protein